MRLEHVALNVPDPDAQAQWFVAHLGMRIVRHSPTPNPTYFLADTAGQSVIEIYRNPAAPVPDYSTMHPLMQHLAFNVGDIEAEAARLVAAGGTLFGEINTTPAGDRLAFLRDPWNVSLQLVQRAKPLI